MEELSKNQINIMKHTISDHNRNWFGTSKGCQDANDFDQLVGLGLAEERNPPSWSGDTALYILTDAGKSLVNKLNLEERRNRPKLTRSQKRYKRYLEFGDSFDNFLHFLSWDGDKDRSWN